MDSRSLVEDWDYPPIGDYGAIGNCKTLALVSRQGSIDWLCLPHFSGPSLFAALLDRRCGGRFAIRPRAIRSVERRYLDDTVVLQTEFRCANGVACLTDFLTVLTEREQRASIHPEHQLIRIVECLQGEIDVDVLYQPRPHYAKHRPKLERRGRLGWYCERDGAAAYLQTSLELAPVAPAAVGGSTTLRAGDRLQFVLGCCSNQACVLLPLGVPVQDRLESTLRWWRAWAAQCTYSGPYREMVVRSALTLKMLTYCLSGAVVAAATTSVPEGASGDRNWDYRYCWLRDTSLVLQSFMDLGFVREAEAFLGWLLHATRLTQPRLQVMYDVFGETALTERVLPHLEGYLGKGPVRTGNAAHSQLQLDVYGEVILTACSFVERGGHLDRYERGLLTGFARSVIKLWREPDASIWEVRAEPRHYTYSKLMCWVALDRLIELRDRIGLRRTCAGMAKVRDSIRREIDSRGYDPEHNSFVGYFGGREPDASLLLLARYGYLGADDRRMKGTVRYIQQRLSQKEGLLYRYPPDSGYDGLRSTDNLFVICSFWLVNYLARAGKVRRAERLFNRLLSFSNDLGLYAEEISADEGTAIGNFPQAFSHVGLVAAALSLDRARQHRRRRQTAP